MEVLKWCNILLIIFIHIIQTIKSNDSCEIGNYITPCDNNKHMNGINNDYLIN